MKFIKVKDVQEIFREKTTRVETELLLNIDNIAYLRDLPETTKEPASLTIFLVGRDKPIKIVDPDSIKEIQKAIGNKSLKE